MISNNSIPFCLDSRQNNETASKCGNICSTLYSCTGWCHVFSMHYFFVCIIFWSSLFMHRVMPRLLYTLLFCMHYLLLFFFHAQDDATFFVHITFLYASSFGLLYSCTGWCHVFSSHSFFVRTIFCPSLFMHRVMPRLLFTSLFCMQYLSLLLIHAQGDATLRRIPSTFHYFTRFQTIYKISHA